MPWAGAWPGRPSKGRLPWGDPHQVAGAVLFTVSVKVAACITDPDVAVTVTVVAAGDVAVPEAPRSPMGKAARNGVPTLVSPCLVPKYRGTIRRMKEITRVQTGVRLESRLVKVLKALATELDLSLGDLLEGIVLHAFEGKAPFSAATLKKIKALKSVYGLDLTAEDSHRLREVDGQ